jgi:hypothetical protein
MSAAIETLADQLCTDQRLWRRCARLPVELVSSASLGKTRATERTLISAIAIPSNLRLNFDNRKYELI